MGKQRVNIPDEMATPLLYAVGEAVDLFGLDFTIFVPAYNVPPGGCADVDSKEVFHSFTSGEKRSDRISKLPSVTVSRSAA